MFASGWFLSSKIWYSSPIDEPSPWFKLVSTKYLIPLFAPSDILKSNSNSKFENFSRVTISPPLDDSEPSFANTVKILFSITQPCLGNLSSLAPLHPSKVFPSHRNLQLFFIWFALKTLSILLISGA